MALSSQRQPHVIFSPLKMPGNHQFAGGMMMAHSLSSQSALHVDLCANRMKVNLMPCVCVRVCCCCCCCCCLALLPALTPTPQNTCACGGEATITDTGRRGEDLRNCHRHATHRQAGRPLFQRVSVSDHRAGTSEGVRHPGGRDQEGARATRRWFSS